MQLVLELWDELRAKGSSITSVARGASMWPAVPDGSWLTVTPCEATSLRRGELVMFRRHDTIVTHRVVEVRGDGTVLAWGDSVLWPDAPVAAEDVFGRAVVCKRSPALGRAFHPGVALRWPRAHWRRALWAVRSASVVGR